MSHLIKITVINDFLMLEPFYIPTASFRQSLFLATISKNRQILNLFRYLNENRKLKEKIKMCYLIEFFSLGEIWFDFG